jgi:hypothetical protein
MSVRVVTQLRGCITTSLGTSRGMVCGSGNVWALSRIGLALSALCLTSGYGPLANNVQTIVEQGAKRIKARIAKQWSGFRPKI